MSRALFHKLIRNPAFFCIVAVVAFVGFFEFLPAVKNAQAYVSLQNYERSAAPCGLLLDDRPWYGRLNHWFFSWMVIIPAFIFLFPPSTRVWPRAVRTVSAISICYILMNLAVHLQWKIRNAPFGEDPFGNDIYDGWRMDCVNIGDGFSIVFALIMGWIPACVYVGLCLCFWFFYHRYFSKEITADYKSDIVTRTLSVGVKIYLVLTLLFTFALIAHKAGLFDVKPIGWVYYFTLRPLMIPFEIFLY